MKIQSVLLIFCLAACSPSEGVHHPVAGGATAQQTGEVVGFDKVRPIFANFCSECHPSRWPPNWLDYNQARPLALSGRLHQRIIEQKPTPMPPPGTRQSASISQADRDLIGAWVRAGAPQQSHASEKLSTAEPEPGAAQSCLQCHGLNRPGYGTQPRIARINGQNEEYLKMQMHRFKWRERIDPSNTMNDVASGLSDSEIDEVAAFFSKPRKPAIPEPDRVSQLRGRDKLLFKDGENYAAVNCISCHMNPEYDRLPSSPLLPILSGQSKQYLIDQLLYFRNEERRSPIMHQFVKGLSNDTIEALAIYFTTVDDGH